MHRWFKATAFPAGLALALSACQSTNPQDYAADHDCLQKKAGSKILAKLTGVGLSVAGVPGGGIVGRGVSIATDPRCQAFRLTPEAEARIRRERPQVQEHPRETIHNITVGGSGA